MKEKRVYLKGLHVAEVGVANGLKRLIAEPGKAKGANINKSLEGIQEKCGKVLSDGQIDAVKLALSHKVGVVTGGPGSGKTTILKVVIEVCRKLNMAFLLGAPTGRAAKRMSEATGYEAKTLHRLLEYSPAENTFKKNEYNKLGTDFVIVDETSMVDTPLMYHLLKAMPLHASLLLIGDADQLASVGPGRVLKDIIDSGVVPTMRLNEIFRQSKGSMIITNAHRINQGLMPLFTQDGDFPIDFRFVEIDDADMISEKIVKLCAEEIPMDFGADPLNDIQVLTPQHKGVVGTQSLNAKLQAYLNRSDEGLRIGEITLKLGDKVMQTVNNYIKDVYNGDIGRIVELDNEIQNVRVNYGEKIVTYDYADIDEIILAYAISVHKSQGSEYPVVIMPVSMQHYRLLERCLFYTAVTRARKLVMLVGERKALRTAIRNNSSQRRFTNLKNRLQ